MNRRDLLKTGSAAAALTASGMSGPALAQDERWTHETDVVVVGSGATGLLAAIVAREAGCSVIIVEAQPHIGGHAICSGGNVPLGGGTRRQKKYDIADTPDLLFRDLTDWSVVEPNGFPDYRYNDREIIRAFADDNVAAFDFLEAHGVVFVEKAPDKLGGTSVGNSVPRENHAAVMDWPMVQTGAPADPEQRKTKSSGNGLMLPLAAAALQAGRADPARAPDDRARPAKTLERKSAWYCRRVSRRAGHHPSAEGGDPRHQRLLQQRQFPPPVQPAPYGGVLRRRRSALVRPGCERRARRARDRCRALGPLQPDRRVRLQHHQAGHGRQPIRLPQPAMDARQPDLRQGPRDGPQSEGLAESGPGEHDREALLRRDAEQFTGNDYNAITPYVQGSYLNAKNNPWDPRLFLAAAMAGISDGHNGGGPIWAIFDAAAAAREQWEPKPPNVDVDGGFFFSARALAELAREIEMPYQRVKMPPEALEATVARYNAFVETGLDEDFGEPKPLFKVITPPFYAAWATPVLHDTRAGLRINAKTR